MVLLAVGANVHMNNLEILFHNRRDLAGGTAEYGSGSEVMVAGVKSVFQASVPLNPAGVLWAVDIAEKRSRAKTERARLEIQEPRGIYKRLLCSAPERVIRDAIVVGRRPLSWS
jgi:hypothetical protein